MRDGVHTILRASAVALLVALSVWPRRSTSGERHPARATIAVHTPAAPEVTGAKLSPRAGARAAKATAEAEEVSALND